MPGEGTDGIKTRVNWLYAILLTAGVGVGVASWQSSKAESQEFRKEFKEELRRNRDAAEVASKELGDKVVGVQLAVAQTGAKLDALVSQDFVGRKEFDAMRQELERLRAKLDGK
jgi:hypothetical protein